MVRPLTQNPPAAPAAPPPSRAGCVGAPVAARPGSAGGPVAARSGGAARGESNGASGPARLWLLCEEPVSVFRYPGAFWDGGV